MDKPSAKLFSEALQLLDTYYRSVVMQIAEEIVANRKKFEGGGGGRAAKIVDEHAAHLQNLGRIQNDLESMFNRLSAPAPGSSEGMPVAPSGRYLGADTPLAEGAAVLVEWGGSWWRANVIESESDGTVRIHYAGWGDNWDETVPRSRIQEDTGTGPVKMSAPGGTVAPSGRPIGPDVELAPGTPVLVEWGGSWWQASVLRSESDGTVRIHYSGWNDEWDETVPRSRIQEDTGTGPAPSTAAANPVAPSGRPIGPDVELAPGMAVLVEWGGTWWPATVIRSDPNGGARIHYTGWGNDWDETVPRSRIQEDPASKSAK